MAFVSFWGFLCNYALRININLAIVEMVNGTSNTGNGSTSDECGRVSEFREGVSFMMPAGSNVTFSDGHRSIFGTDDKVQV